MQRLPDGSVEPADGREWVPDIVGTEHFYCHEKTDAARRQKASVPLIEWGLPVPTNDDGKAYRQKKTDKAMRDQTVAFRHFRHLSNRR